MTDSTEDVNRIKVDFNNMIICNKLKTETSKADDSNHKNVIVIPKLVDENSWENAQIVAKQFKDNFDNRNIKSDFALLALFLGYFKKDSTMIDIKVKSKSIANQDIHTNNINIA